MLLLAAAGVVAFIIIATIRSQRYESERRPSASTLFSSIVFEVARSGTASEEVVRNWMQGERLVPPREAIDLSSWASAFERASPPEARSRLLAKCVEGALLSGRVIGSKQFHQIQDLAFSFGFHADEIHRLRDRYGFDYVDYAKERRPREADRAGGATSFFNRARGDDDSADLVLLGFSAMPSRSALVSAYRRLVLENHPDRLHVSGSPEEEAAARKFIAITAAYERLLSRMSE